jgi:hypothetical protein
MRLALRKDMIVFSKTSTKYCNGNCILSILVPKSQSKSEDAGLAVAGDSKLNISRR